MLWKKKKSIQRTEYEKLLYQINPHFLLNTLNSVQWMARMSRQDNITEFVQRLKRLLSYNLGKEGMQTTLRTEIDIVKDYIALEQMRYDFVIEMNVEEGRYLEQPTVRMLLQPLVDLEMMKRSPYRSLRIISGDWRSLPYWTAVMA